MDIRLWVLYSSVKATFRTISGYFLPLRAENSSHYSGYIAGRKSELMMSAPRRNSCTTTKVVLKSFANSSRVKLASR